MKILHISTGDNRGAYSAAYRLHGAIRARGHQSFMLVADKRTDDIDVLAVQKSENIIRRITTKLVSQIDKILFGVGNVRKYFMKSGIPLFKASNIINKIKKIDPDFIIVYYTSYFLTPGQLRKILNASKKPVAIYLMDMEWLTAACHYAWDCAGYLSNCSSCKMVRYSWVDKLVYRRWITKKNLYDELNPIVVAGSSWIENQAKNSSLTRSMRIVKILAGINPSVFAPGSKKLARESLGINFEGLIIYFGSQHISDKRKGFSYLFEALGLLDKTMSSEKKVNIALLTVGDSQLGSLSDLGFRHFHLPFIGTECEFADTYRAADVFICPSVEDSGPMMINEAMMSGTPVIAFKMGVALDFLLNNNTGYLVNLYDAQGIADAVTHFSSLGDSDRKQMSDNCRNLALNISAIDEQVRRFEALF